MALIRCLLLLVGICQITHAAPISEEESFKQYEEEHPEEFGNFVEGDMILEDEFRNALISKSSLWPGGKIYYVIDSTYSSTQRRSIETQAALFKKYTCLEWIPRTTQRAYVKIYKGSGCSSTVGKSSWGSVQTLSLSDRCFRVGTIIHEMLHAVGFYHEQGRYDRDKYITINYENIRPGKERNFRKLSSSQIQHLGAAYDYGSVMHYGRKSFSKNYKETITPKDKSKEIGQRRGFSKIDIYKVNKLYNCRM